MNNLYYYYDDYNFSYFELSQYLTIIDDDQFNV